MLINEIIEKIIKEEIPCYFISPHLDDAVFSAGGLLAFLACKTKITLITVFTEASGPPYTLSSKIFLTKCGGFHSAFDLFEKRRLEDKAACCELKANMIHLGFVDGFFRKKRKDIAMMNVFDRIIPELNHVYPIYRLNIVSGKISQFDKATMFEIEKRLESIKNIMRPGFVFCPRGTGGHVDHILVRDICKKIFTNLIFWDDFPYNIRKNSKIRFVKKNNFSVLDISAVASDKLKIMACYKSQVMALRPRLAELPPEIYFMDMNKINFVK